jgi:osmotically-inducible protein OsmY
MADSVVDYSAKPELASRVKTFLGGQHIRRLAQIRIEAVGDTVILKGTVRSFHERQLAIACCKRVAGARRIDDRLQVSPHPRGME